MSETIQQKILDGVLLMLRPMAKLMLRCGVSYTEFSDLAKIAFVDVAAKEFGIRGRQTNASRIAIMTGLSRKEIKRIRDLGDDRLSSDFVRETPGSVVLQHWQTNPRFTDQDGNPRVLSFKDGPDSFSELVATCAGDIPPGAMRAELLRVGSIERMENGLLRKVKTQYCPDDLEERNVLALNEILPTALATAAHNCQPGLTLGVDTFFQGVSCASGVNDETIERVRPIIRQKLIALSDDIGDYLGPHENLGSEEESPNQIGIGLYYYELGTDK